MSKGSKQKDEGLEVKSTGIKYKVVEVDNSAMELFLNNLDETSEIVSVHSLNQLRSLLVYKEQVSTPRGLKDFANLRGKKV